MVVFKKDFEPTNHLEWNAEYDVECIIKSTYDDYGRVAATKDATDDYIESVTGCHNMRFHIFICKMAWDWAVLHYPLKHRPMLGDSVPVFENLVKSLEAALEAELKKKKSKTAKDKKADADIRKTIKNYKALIEENRPIEWISEMKAVFCAFFYAHRSPLAGYWATGQYSNDSIPGILAHLKLTEERLVQLVMERPASFVDYDEDTEPEPESMSEPDARAFIAKLKLNADKTPKHTWD